jgi:restriction system protein
LRLFLEEQARMRLDESDGLSELLNLHPREFEHEIGRLFGEQGYAVNLTPYSGDGGRDIVASRGGAKVVIECKRYGPARGVSRPELQRFTAVVHHERATHGFFITTGRFSPKALEWAMSYPNLELVDGRALVAMIRRVRRLDEERVYWGQCTECGTRVRFPLQEIDQPTTCGCGVRVTFEPERGSSLEATV